MKTALLLVLALVLPVAARQDTGQPPRVLPAPATTALAASLKAAEPHTKHLWRDTPPFNGDGTITAYVEIGTGDRRKWEFDIGAHARRIDRMIPADIGGYPINYGFVPQTVSYDGDPFDALILGPALPGGRFVRGVPVGVMFMEDEKGLDSKIVLSPIDGAGRPRYALTAAVQRDVATYFRNYKKHEPEGFSRVPGWGSVEEGLALVRITHAFFRECRSRAGSPCALP